MKNEVENIDLRKKILDNFYESLSECRGYVESELLEKAKDYILHNLEKINSFDGPCIVHRDYRPGNVIFKNGSIKAVIDFENAMISCSEEDFSAINLLVWDKYPKTKNSFLKGYSSKRKLPDLERTLPVLRVVKILGAIGFTIARKTYNNKHKYIFDSNLNLLKDLL